MALTWPSKEAIEALSYEIDWTARLQGDTIASANLTIAAGSIAIDSDSNTTTTQTAFISGGTKGETAVLVAEIVTTAGNTMQETIVLPIAAQESTYAAIVETPYQTVEDIDRYMVGAFSDAATAWLAADIQTKQSAAIAATRVIDRQTWQGVQVTVPGPAWPRSDLYYADGATPVDDTTVPEPVLSAVSEIAALLVSGSDLQDVASTYDFTRSLKAGSVEITKFRARGPAPRFPQVIQELIGLWLGSGEILSLTESHGTHGRSEFRRPEDVTRGL